jgi:hypothetical protein
MPEYEPRNLHCHKAWSFYDFVSQTHSLSLSLTMSMRTQSSPGPLPYIDEWRQAPRKEANNKANDEDKDRNSPPSGEMESHKIIGRRGSSSSPESNHARGDDEPLTPAHTDGLAPGKEESGESVSRANRAFSSLRSKIILFGGKARSRETDGGNADSSGQTKIDGKGSVQGEGDASTKKSKANGNDDAQNISSPNLNRDSSARQTTKSSSQNGQEKGGTTTAFSARNNTLGRDKKQSEK